MIAICEECGRKYRIDPEKIRGTQARFKCKSCSHIITVKKPLVEVSEPTVPRTSEKSDPEPNEKGIQKPEPEANQTSRVIEEHHLPSKGLKRLGLRAKMFLLFFFIPIFLSIVAGLLYVWQLEKLGETFTSESSKAIGNLAERAIGEKARSVAYQVALILNSNPKLKKTDFNSGKFKEVAVQKVGLTGYTALYELPDKDNIWRTWAHANSKIIGIDMSTLKQPLGKNFPGFWEIYTGIKNGKESKGYYTWQEADQSFREKFMVCTPVEGTSFIVAATTYLDEFTKPVQLMNKRASEITAQTKLFVYWVLGGTILLIGVLVLFYGYRLTGKLKSLSKLAERISIGELDAEVDIKSKDEIGDLADAISRMQESIRLSIKRLRRRR